MKRSRWLFAAVALALAGIATSCGGGDDPPGGGPNAATGESLFQGTCQTCHGPGGVGLPGLGKTLIANAFVQSLTDAELIAFIQTGRPVSDPANTTGVGMPPRGGNASLSDDDLADIVAYLRALQ